MVHRASWEPFQMGRFWDNKNYQSSAGDKHTWGCGSLLLDSCRESTHKGFPGLMGQMTLGAMGALHQSLLCSRPTKAGQQESHCSLYHNLSGKKEKVKIRKFGDQAALDTQRGSVNSPLNQWTKLLGGTCALGQPVLQLSAGCLPFLFLFKKKFIFGCVGFSLLHAGFL